MRAGGVEVNILTYHAEEFGLDSADSQKPVKDLQ